MMQNYCLMVAVSVYLSNVYTREIVGDSIQAKVTRSTVEHLGNQSTYIICFKSNVTEVEYQQFAAVLETKSKMAKEFAAEIIEKFLIIKCLTVKLSKEAMDWVKIYIKYLASYCGL